MERVGQKTRLFSFKFEGMIKPECIGQTHTKKAPNGMPITVTIKSDPGQFDLYRLLKLDVFMDRPKAKVVEVKKEPVPEPKEKRGTAKKHR